MGNRHALSQARRTELFASEQTIENYRPGKPQAIFEEHAGLLENTLLAAGFEIKQNLIGGK